MTVYNSRNPLIGFIRESSFGRDASIESNHFDPDLSLPFIVSTSQISSTWISATTDNFIGNAVIPISNGSFTFRSFNEINLSKLPVYLDYPCLKCRYLHFMEDRDPTREHGYCPKHKTILWESDQGFTWVHECKDYEPSDEYLEAYQKHDYLWKPINQQGILL